MGLGHRKVRRLAVLAAVAAAAIVLPASRAHAATIVNDTWQDADRTQPASPTYSEYGTDADADGDIESAWFNGGTGATAVASTGHLLLTPSTGSASWTNYFTPAATPVTLSNTGDSIHVRWAFKTGDVNVSNTSQNFRIALVDTATDANRLTVDGAPGSDTYPGYALFGNMGETTGNGNSFQLRERLAATNSDILATSGNWTALANGLGNTAVGYTDNTNYQFDLTLTRNASSGLDILMTMTGGTIGGTGTVTVNFTDPTPSSFTYDTFEIRPSGSGTTATSFDTTQFLVEGPVPEPSSMALAGVAAIGLLRRGRRSRN
jgi:hypothetical protein